MLFHAAAEHAIDTCVNSCWQARKKPEAAPGAPQAAANSDMDELPPAEPQDLDVGDPGDAEDCASLVPLT